MVATMDDPNIIEELDDEGNVVNTIHIDLCNEIADGMLEDLADLQGEVTHFDFGVASFGLFVNCVHILLDQGWTMEELVKEVTDHALCHATQGEPIN